MKSSKVICNIMSFVCFVFGAIYLFSLVFIPIGIYCFAAGKLFSYKAEHLLDDVTYTNKIFKYYVIFVSIVCFPFGLLSIIPYKKLTSNNIKIDGYNYTNVQAEREEEKQSETVQENQNELSENEKFEKFKKLQNFRDKGLLTDDELELAREQLFGKNEE